MCHTTHLTPYAVTIKQYAASLVLKGGLSATAQYFYLLIDKFNRRYYGNLMVDQDGNGYINLLGYDKYDFNKDAGPFVLTVKDGNDIDQSMVLGGRPVRQVVITFADIQDELGNPHNVIQ